MTFEAAAEQRSVWTARSWTPAPSARSASTALATARRSTGKSTSWSAEQRSSTMYVAVAVPRSARMARSFWSAPSARSVGTAPESARRRIVASTRSLARRPVLLLAARTEVPELWWRLCQSLTSFARQPTSESAWKRKWIAQVDVGRTRDCSNGTSIAFLRRCTHQYQYMNIITQSPFVRPRLRLRFS